ncbi:MAG: hypothetical protein D6696_10115, partial [Acidobacteria bacterium]
SIVHRSASFPAAAPPTGASGKTSFELSASDSGDPRRFIDGQLYGVAYARGRPGNPDPWDFVSGPVHTDSIDSGTPTWNDDVEPVLGRYKKLYPFMLNFVDLGSYRSVEDNAAAIQRASALPMADPAHMPVTRDLSDSKRRMIFDRFAAGMPEG